ncbi:MAG: hypothetical protein H6825_16250 [Planctomycetes bacterium]|nr:hypothetical protein [Planctomycetota bacterium]
MIDLLRRWSVLLCITLLAWLTVGTLEGEPVSLADDGGFAEDHLEILPIQLQDEVDAFLEDSVREPFRLAPTSTAVDPWADIEEDYVAPQVVPTTVPFELRLNSVVDFGQGMGTANISGHTVNVGQDVPGLDPDSPPRLLAIEGPAALVEHRGTYHLLDMRGTRAIFIGPIPLVADEDASADDAEAPIPPDAKTEPGSDAAPPD